jgi:eukaryotic-like serine/threonine-protein kinase
MSHENDSPYDCSPDERLLEILVERHESILNSASLDISPDKNDTGNDAVDANLSAEVANFDDCLRRLERLRRTREATIIESERNSIAGCSPKPHDDVLHESNTTEPSPSASGTMQNVAASNADWNGRDSSTPPPGVTTIKGTGNSKFTVLPLANVEIEGTAGELTDGTSGLARCPQFGRFTILRELGRGGLGVVLLAFDPVLQRHVALKIPRPEALLTRDLRQRFRREAQAAGRLTHPNIVPVHEVGEVGPVCFIASAFVEGQSLADWIKEIAGPADPRAAAAIVVELAKAMAYAHSQGVLHRDLKPGNVLLEPRSSEAISAGGGELSPTAKIADFGLAKILDLAGDETRTGAIIGTPAYMSPEQAKADHGDIGPATDIYALGAVLYELLTGRPPFRARSDAETLRLVVCEEPTALRRVNPDCPRDLEAICRKCLEKQPRRRYATATELARDLERFLRNEPTKARNLSRLQRARRWCQRNPLPAVLGTAVLLTFALGVAVSTRFAFESSQRATEAEMERNRAIDAQHASEQQRDLARRSQYFAQMNVAQQAWDSGNVAQCLDILSHLVPREGESDLRGFEYHRLRKLCNQNVMTLKGHTKAVMAISQSADSRVLLSGGVDGRLLLWNPQSGTLVRTLAEGLDAGPGKGVEKDVRGVRAVAPSSDGKLAASVTLDEIQIWNVEDGKLLHTLKKAACDCFGVALSSDGKLLAALVPTAAVQVWDTTTGAEHCRVEFGWLAGNISALAISPDCATIAVAVGLPVGAGMVRFIDVRAGQEISSKRLSGHRAAIVSLAYAPDGKRLATGSIDQTINIWDLDTKTVESSLVGHQGFVTAVKFSADGNQCVSAGADHTVRVWDIATQRLLSTMRGHTDLVTGLLVDQADGKIITSSGDGTIRVWPRALESYQKIGLLPDLTTTNESVSPFVAAMASSYARPYLVPSVSLSADGRRLGAIVVGPDGNGAVEVRTVDGSEKGRRFVDDQQPKQSFSCSALSPDGSLMAAGAGNFLSSFVLTATRGHAVPKVADAVIWRLDTGQIVHRLSGHKHEIFSLAFSSVGDLLATGDTGGAVRLWRLPGQEQELLFEGDKEPAIDMRFSRDGRFLAAASAFTDTVRIWELATGIVTRLTTSFPTAVAFSPDGSQLAVGSGSFLADRATAHGEVVVWDWQRGTALPPLKGNTQFIRRTVFNADGSQLWSIGFDGAARLWDLKTGYEVVKLDGNFRFAMSADLSTDGTRLVVGTEGGEAILWDAPVND